MSNVSRILRVLGRVFAAIALVGTAAAIALAVRQTLVIDGMLPTTGEVVAFQNRKPVVRFPVSATRSVTIVGGTASTPPAYDIGQSLRVYYDPNQPTNAVIDSYLERWFLPTLVGGLAGLFGVLGTGFLIYTALSDRRVAWLRRNGVKVAGRIADVQYNRYIQLDRKPTWQIAAEWSANGTSGRAWSFHLMQDPRPLLGDWQEIDVWVDPKNPRNAWVDTDFLDPHHAVARVASPIRRL